MIVTQLQFGSDVLGDSAKVLGHALEDSLHGLGRDGAVRPLLARACPLLCGAAFDHRRGVTPAIKRRPGKLSVRGNKN
jgi:hypothetical protein